MASIARPQEERQRQKQQDSTITSNVQSHIDPPGAVLPAVSSSGAAPSPPLSTPTTTNTSTSHTVTTAMDVNSCSPQDLAFSLINHRGVKASLELLQEATKIVEQTVTSSTQEGTGNDNGQAEATAAAAAAAATTTTTKVETAPDLGAPLLEEPFETSFASPRLGKFSIQLYEHGLQATKVNDPSVTIVISTNVGVVVSHILAFPKPEDCKTLLKSGGKDVHKTSGNLILIRLQDSMTVQNKPGVQQFCFALPSQKKMGPVGPKVTTEAAAAMAAAAATTTTTIKTSSSENARDDNGNDHNDPTTAWCRVLGQSLKTTTSTSAAQVKPGRSGTFQSYQPPNQSTTSGGMPFVNCYHGVNDGVLYPLREGLLFFKPPRFWPRADLHSIACGRGGGSGGGGGSGSSRYVDMNVTLQGGSGDDKIMEEFTNIQREENPALNAYIHNVLIPAMQRDTQDAQPKQSTGEVVVVAEAVTNEEDDDDGAVEVEAELADDDHCSDDGDEKDEDDFEEDEDFEETDEDEEEEDEGVFGGQDDDEDDDDGEFEVVKDDFAKSLAKKKREEGGESGTESEEDNGPRTSKRLRQG